jgi:hypothetical protein
MSKALRQEGGADFLSSFILDRPGRENGSMGQTTISYSMAVWLRFFSIEDGYLRVWISFLTLRSVVRWRSSFRSRAFSMAMTA